MPISTAPIQSDNSPAEQVSYQVDRAQSRGAYNESFLAPGGALLFSGATTADISTQVGVVSLPNSGNPTLAWHSPKRELWRGSGNLIYRLIYSGSANDGDYFVFIRGMELAEGDLLSGSVDLFQSVTLTGPSSADEVMEQVFTTPMTINGDGLVLSSRFVRTSGNAADTNTGDLYILGLYATYKELGR